MTLAVVEYENRGHLVIITMNRPESLNAMGRELVTGLAGAWTRYRDDPEARVAILTGVGRAFCVGMDVKERAESGEKGLGLAEDRNRDPFYTEKLEKPTIAAVNGYAFGGGYYMTARSDLRVAVESATFQISEIVRGGMGGYANGLDQTLPYPIAVEFALGGIISAQRAYEVGFLNKVVKTNDELLLAAIEMADKLLELPPLSVLYTLRLMKTLRAKQPAETVELAGELTDKLTESEDAAESIRSFIEKRKPVYKGR